MTRGLGGAAARGIALPGLVALLAGLALLLALPALLSASMLNAAIQMLIAALFACAFNLLCGQGGMLSFGHSAYFGVGVFATVHAMNALAGQGLLPTPLLPVVGALAGMVFGAIAGWFATQRTGTYFAMITLALAELVHALAPHIKGVFGGESGVSAMRMPAWGFSFGEGRHLYYMTLFWVLLALLLLYGYTRTPLGRLTLGLRENGHRLRFLGYNTHLLAVLVFTVSSMFSGLAGGLQAVNNELGNYVVFDAQLSSSVAGPMLAALVATALLVAARPGHLVRGGDAVHAHWAGRAGANLGAGTPELRCAALAAAGGRLAGGPGAVEPGHGVCHRAAAATVFH